MQSSNPAFRNNAAFGGRASASAPLMTDEQLRNLYDSPAHTPVHERRMTLDSVVLRSAATFAVLVVAAAANYRLNSNLLTFGGAIAAFVLSLVISRRMSTNPALILGYAALQGLAVGGISAFYQAYANDRIISVGDVSVSGDVNIVGQAVLGTLAAFAAMLVVYRLGWLRATPKFTRGLMVAGLAYLGIALVSVVSSFFGVGGGFGFYGVGALGTLLCVAGVALATLFLVLDFDFIEKGIAQGVPERTAWYAAFGLTQTLVWIYLEILRLLAVLRGND